MQPASLNGVARSQSAGPGSFTSAPVLRDCSLPVLEKQEVVRQEAGTSDNNHLCSGWGWSIFSSDWLLSVLLKLPFTFCKTRQRNQEPARIAESWYTSPFRWIKANVADYNTKFSAQDDYRRPRFEHVTSTNAWLPAEHMMMTLPSKDMHECPLLKPQSLFRDLLGKHHSVCLACCKNTFFTFLFPCCAHQLRTHHEPNPTASHL